MGSHKKSKKARNRSRSRSRDTEIHRGSKSKRSRRRKSLSRSSSSDSGGGDRYRSPSRSPERKRKKKSKKSRSRSRERYSEKSRKSRSRSREHRGSRGSSPSGSRSRQRSRSSSRSRRRRRSRSRSHSSEKIRGSKSKDTSKTASPLPFKNGAVKDTTDTSEERPLESLQEKMQKALEAAATADAQLRQQGILTSMTRNEILTQKEERDRQKKLATIEKDSFHQQSFKSSGQSSKSNKAQQPVYGISRDLNHDAAIFSSNNISDLQNTARYLDSVQPRRNGKLASDFLSVSKEEKEERWFLKLQALRKQRLEGKPVTTKKKGR